MLTAGICELTLETRDMAALERFYREVIRCGVMSREEERDVVEVWDFFEDRGEGAPRVEELAQ